MSTMPGRLSEDTRFELAASAAARERRNRPMWIVGAAAVLLAGVLLVALLGISMNASARADLRRELEDQAHVEQLLGQLRQLTEAQSDAGATNIGTPMTDLRTRLETLARTAGFKDAPFSTNEDVRDIGNGIRIRKMPYFNVKAPSLGVVLEWLRLATQDPASRIPGLEVESLTMKPDPKDNTWSMNFTLRRWERAG
jgi:hypothetical protein